MTRLLYRSVGFGLFSNFALSVILVAGAWSYFPKTQTLGWLAVAVFVTLLRTKCPAWMARRGDPADPRAAAGPSFDHRGVDRQCASRGQGGLHGGRDG